MKKVSTIALLTLAWGLGVFAASATDSRPSNVLFISIDDLNDWIGCLGGHPQALTPNIDRLAKTGVLFTNAHCPAPACNPSRTAVMTGISPHHSGLYGNGQNMREILPDAVLLPRYFADHGYWAGGSGKLLHYFIDALDNGPNRDNTIVVLWSDHGWHLGEKRHWQKYTAWRVCSRVPLIVRVPAGAPGLPEGAIVGVSCTKPVSLVSLFATLTELAGLPKKPGNDGPSFVPLLRNPKTEWPHVAVTYLQQPGSYGLSGERWRYIHYADGGEELYDIQEDPHEWNNLIGAAVHQGPLDRLRRLAPKSFAPVSRPKNQLFQDLEWHSAGLKPLPASRPHGPKCEIVLTNQRAEGVDLHVVDAEGRWNSRGSIQSGWRFSRETHPGAVWVITDSEDRQIGHFVVEEGSARATIPRG